MAAGAALGAPDRPVAFSVPTGNFGNVFSAYVAQKLGLPIERLVIATNQNDILTRFFETGAMTIEGVRPSISPSMDIQVSSNFERLLFELYDRDGKAVTETLTSFRTAGTFSAGGNMMSRAGELFSAFRSDEAETKADQRVRRDSGMIVDPHSAVGLTAVAKAPSAGTIDPTTPLISLACAHPAKFADAVTEATGTPPELPKRLQALLDLPERHIVIRTTKPPSRPISTPRPHRAGPPDGCRHGKRRRLAGDVQVTTLDNGARVITDRMEGVASAFVGAWFGVGTRNEAAEANGVAHLLEHMAFKGTKRRSPAAIAEEIEAAVVISRLHLARADGLLRPGAGAGRGPRHRSDLRHPGELDLR